MKTKKEGLVVVTIKYEIVRQENSVVPNENDVLKVCIFV